MHLTYSLKRIGLFIFILLLSLGSKSATVSINGGSNGTTISICDLSTQKLLATTDIVDPKNNSYKYKWEWYKDGVKIYEDPYDFATNSNLPTSLISQGVFSVKLTVNGYYIILSNDYNLKTIGQNGQYSGNSITYRTISGDFDRDGKEDDIAAFYYYGNFNTTLHVWKSDGSSFVYQGDNGWWKSTQYDASKLVGVVSGDFDRDGFKDDIVGFYNYGSNQIAMHVWKSTGASLSYQGDNGWWKSNDYNGNKIIGRVVSGDFDKDGYKDDIAAFYDYGNFKTNIHVWQSTGSLFGVSSTTGWYSNNSYDANKISFRLISGDFDRDGYEAEITAFYDYGNNETSAHVWRSTGSNFSGPASNGWWNSKTYNASKITGKVVSGDFDKDGFKDDIAAFYDYGYNNTSIHIWQSTGTTLTSPSTSGWWSSSSYNSNQIIGRVVSGDFNNDNIKDNITAFYDYGNYSITAHTWNSNSTNMIYGGDIGWWQVCNSQRSNINYINSDEFFTPEIIQDSIVYEPNIEIYPNPSTGIIYVSSSLDFNRIIVYDLNGVKKYEESNLPPLNSYEINLNQLSSGIYFLEVSSEFQKEHKKIFIK